MSNNKQSSVEWFWLNIDDDLIGELSPEKILKIYELYEQAKAMHKEEIISNYLQGANDEAIERNARERFLIKKDAEQYYNATYEGNNG